MTGARTRELSSRDAILDAATDLICRLGYAAASISRISTACGLPASSIYWHFGSKDGIYLAVLERTRIDLVGALPDPVMPGDTVDARLTAFLDAIRTVFERRPQDLRLWLGLGMLDEEAGAAVLARLHDYRTSLREWATAALSSVFELTDRPDAAAELARFVLSVSGGTMLSRWFDDPATALPVASLRTALLALAEAARG
jgi:AcrR family transcriptional regulator